MFQFIDKPSTVLQIYKQSFALYKEVFAKIWYVILLNFVIINTIQYLGSKSAVVTVGTNITKLGMVPWIYYIVGIILSMYFAAVVVHRVYHIAANQAVPLISSYAAVLRKLIFIVPTGIIAVILVSLGFILLWIPGIFLLFLFIFCLAAILFEDKKVFSAIKRSYQLVWGNWWHTFSSFILVAIIGLLFVVLLITLFKGTNSMWLIGGAAAAFFIIVGPLYFSIYMVQYNDLKLREKQQE